MRLLIALLLALVASSASADVDMKTCSVSNTSAVCVPANGARQQIEIRNAGASVVAYCSTICPATTTNGFPIPVSGANPWKEIGNELAGQRVCCITASSTTTLAWRELTRKGQVTSPSPTPIPTPTPAPT